MKRRALLCLLPLLSVLSSCSPEEQSTATLEDIGTYDSRALAIAFVGSPLHEGNLSGLMALHQKAKATGDTATVAKLEAQGQAAQKKIHQQAFGTAPVDDILSQIPGQIATIKKEAGVIALISKWNAPELAKHPGVKTIDLTLPLIEALKPTAQQRQRAIEILKKDPLNPSRPMK
ncbi:hypothetical protein V2O64_17060 [Verrucomicrobiaceae bacterium 227]